MNKTFSTLLFLLFSFTSLLAQTEAFKIYNKDGKEVSFETMATAAAQAEVTFFGELHNNAMAHWLQLRLLKSLQSGNGQVVLAAEFFERDDQLNINEWFSGKITDKNFETEAKLWNNYITDYKPLMLFAKQNKIPFVASNIPRKYASLVSREGLKGLDSLSEEAKKYFATLPLEVDKTLPGYKGMADLMHGSSMNMDFMVEAQAIKDATMAYSLYDFLQKGNVILHVNGSYHSNNYEGIVWYLKRDFPQTKIMTINTVEQQEILSLDEKHLQTADFIIVIPLDGPKSY
ncbi:ChaN family lipoprotein [Cecembia calidifontis]|uniref:Putative iron-regulated protein n=1 Tax=Cecembia calidifontis TaxID=1187080 RepID=A0A4Q7PBJ4_9BACT|nr:ChaN family lipoprotein [Cecembia calidifontis]RZS97068.1 putative iron-regulated protein [Cecembia calidifontis]